MQKAFLRLLSLSVLATAASHIQAAPLTGADIFASPNSSFPGTQPTVSGTSLVFGPGPTPNIYEKLLRYLILPAGNLPASGPVSLSATINFTRLACGGGQCAPPEGADDFDPLFSFGSGATGRRFGFGVSERFAGTAGPVVLDDAGTIATSLNAPASVQDTGFPGIGEADTVAFTLSLTDSDTSVTGTFRSSQASFTWNEIFPRANDIAFFLFRDNDNGEQYQINSVEFVVPDTRTPAPEPGVLALLGLGLAGFALSRRKHG